MSEPEYFRVNITSATSTPKYNVWGEKVAEVDMMLPSNLLPSNNVRRARMGVMKMEFSVAKVPYIVADIGSTPETGYYRYTNYYLGWLPAKQNITSGRFVKQTGAGLPLRKIYNWRRLDVPITHLQQGKDEIAIQEANQTGIREFMTVDDFTSWLSLKLSDALPKEGTSTPLICKLAVNEDNTFSLILNHRIFSNYICVPHSQEHMTSDSNYDAVYIFEQGATENRYVQTSVYSGYFIANDALAHELPSLPWIKIRPFWDGGESMFPDGTQNVPDYIYVLDTKQALYSVEQSQNVAYALEGEPSFYHFPIYTFKFNTSDVVTCSDISSIVLCMNGTSFNQMVYPINISATTMAESQTTTVPIVEVYYPMMTRPSDTRTDVIITKENFSSAAPCNINPSLLKERSIKFKLYYITNKGVMREMYIPTETNLSFQICFELFPF